jgi:hypothetical protein
MSEAIVSGILLIVLLIERANLTSLCSRTYCDPNVPVPYCLGFATGRVFRCAQRFTMFLSAALPSLAESVV